MAQSPSQTQRTDSHVFTAWHDPERDRTATQSIVSAVSEFAAIPQESLEPLDEYVPTSALDALFGAAGAAVSPLEAGRLEFEYMEYLVSIDDVGKIEVTQKRS